jgi:6-phosphogluconolactonase
MSNPDLTGPGASGVSPDVRVVADPARVLADRLAEVAAAGGNVAVSGGSVAGRAYALLGERAGGDWSSTTVWYADDRAVPPDHEHSNHGMIASALWERLPAGRAPTIHRVEGERGFEAAAAHYDALMCERLGEEPVLDFVLLGLGPDAHTASLYPGRPEADTVDRLAVGVPEAGWEPYVPRVTMTLPVFNAAREVVFIVAGADKARAVARAFGDPPDYTSPAARVRPTDGRLVVVLDEAAAGELA